MPSNVLYKLTATSSGIAALVLTGLMFQGSNVQAQPPALDPDKQFKMLKGFQIAPVPLNMVGKDASLVGYGSYLVNAVADCNGCHSAGPPDRIRARGNAVLWSASDGGQSGDLPGRRPRFRSVSGSKRSIPAHRLPQFDAGPHWVA